MVTPTGTVSAALRFGLPPAVRIFRTHAQAGLLCGFRNFLRLRRVACWYGLQKALPPKRVKRPFRCKSDPYGNSLRCAPIRTATGSPNVPNPCASGFVLRISEFSSLAPGHSGYGLQKALPPKRVAGLFGEVTDAMSELFFMDSISSEVGMVIGVSSKVRNTSK